MNNLRSFLVLLVATAASLGLASIPAFRTDAPAPVIPELRFETAPAAPAAGHDPHIALADGDRPQG